MRNPMSPPVVTIVLAAATAVMVVLAANAPLPFHRTVRINAAMFLGLLLYAVFVARLMRRPMREICGPLAVVGAVAATAGSAVSCAAPAVVALSWIRISLGGRCLPARAIAAELPAVGGGILLACALMHLSPAGLDWSAAVWGFGLAQAPVFVGEAPDSPTEGALMPPGLDRVHRRADALLRERRLEQAFRELGL